MSGVVLDSTNALVSKGIIGELHIAGDGLARGYLHQEELTAEKFIDNPFKTNSLMYKTGDVVRYLEDGNIEYLGRSDDQVKIRGFRIELGEIESQLVAIEAIKEAVVLAKEDVNSQKVLVGYVVKSEEISQERIREVLSERLAEYMIPSVISELESMPLTPNGKVDKKALAQLEVQITSSKKYVAPRDETEKKIAEIFEEVLHVERVGIYDNFFELGGNSLLSHGNSSLTSS